ncbi:hypothetical protein PV458_18740 [Streptomyces sp. MN03-5084-2B]|nr:hypothetical protein [Streptomyces sp. MN03-5084-2B]
MHTDDWPSTVEEALAESAVPVRTPETVGQTVQVRAGLPDRPDAHHPQVLPTGAAGRVQNGPGPGIPETCRPITYACRLPETPFRLSRAALR